MVVTDTIEESLDVRIRRETKNLRESVLTPLNSCYHVLDVLREAENEYDSLLENIIKPYKKIDPKGLAKRKLEAELYLLECDNKEQYWAAIGTTTGLCEQTEDRLYRLDDAWSYLYQLVEKNVLPKKAKKLVTRFLSGEDVKKNKKEVKSECNGYTVGTFNPDSSTRTVKSLPDDLIDEITIVQDTLTELELDISYKELDEVINMNQFYTRMGKGFNTLKKAYSSLQQARETFATYDVTEAIKVAKGELINSTKAINVAINPTGEE